MKLRTHRHEAKKLAAKVAANRKAAADRPNKAVTKAAVIRKPIRYRVEIWREADPELRVYSFPVEWQTGRLCKADVLGQIGPRLFEWFLSKIPREQWTDWDEGKAGASIWDDNPPTYLATDEDVPF